MTISHWVKRRGQAELRDNLRAAMRESGRSQRDVIRAAGVGYAHVVGGLQGDNWITREAVDAIAAELEVTADELLGGSCFKGDVDRHPEFDGPTPADRERMARDRAEQAAREAERHAVATGPDRVRALCCGCGSMRTCSTTTAERSWEGEDPTLGYEPHRRRIVPLLCLGECAAETDHAVLLSGSDRDVAEERDHAPTREQIAAGELHELVHRLRGFGVDVRFDYVPSSTARADLRVASYKYDHSKSQWRIELLPGTPARLLVDALNCAWRKIATGDSGLEGHGPGSAMVVCATDDAWDTAVEDLVADMQRLLVVERRRLIEDLRDQAAAHEGPASEEAQ